jgi:hypothetical protein
MGKSTAVLILALGTLVACGGAHVGSDACGVAPTPGPNVDDNGNVTFDPVVVGSSRTLTIPLADTDPTSDETIVSVAWSGADAAAFSIDSTFPIHVPPGSSQPVTLEFTPMHVGSSNATLTLQTAGMGPSPILVGGMGLEATP